MVRVPTIFAFGRAPSIFCFWFPMFAYDEHWEPEASRFHAAVGEKVVVLKRLRQS